MKKAIVIFCSVMIMTVACLSEVWAGSVATQQNNSVAAGFFSSGGINPLVFQGADKFLLKKYYEYLNPSWGWEACSAGFVRPMKETLKMVLFWDGSFAVEKGVFSSAVIERGQWTQWLKPVQDVGYLGDKKCVKKSKKGECVAWETRTPGRMKEE